MGLDIQYARSGSVSIAYQVVGDGERDLVYVPDYVSNLVYGWESPHWRKFYERLAQSFRLILFDKRGTGLSDLGGHFPALETRMDDVRAVLDAVGSSSTVLLGSHDGCSMAAIVCRDVPGANERPRRLPACRARSRRTHRGSARQPCRPPGTMGHAGVQRRDPQRNRAFALRGPGRARVVRQLASGRGSPAVAYALNR